MHRYEVVPSDGNGFIFLREKHKAHLRGEREVIVLLPSIEVPTVAGFEYMAGALMTTLADRGFDVWGVDFRGFGRASRPQAMEQSPADNTPLVRATDALGDLQDAVDFIRSERHITKVHLITWSWSTIVGSMYAIGHPEAVASLMLLAPVHDASIPAYVKPLDDTSRPGFVRSDLPAYEMLPVEEALSPWLSGAPGETAAAERTLSALKEAMRRTDPCSDVSRYMVCRPMGPRVDLYFAGSHRPLFDAAELRVPTLVATAAEDPFADPGLYDRLVATPRRHHVVLESATHWLPFEQADRLVSELVMFTNR